MQDSTSNLIEQLLSQIEEMRAKNNRHFMRAWRLLFKLAPKEAAQIQSDIRDGDKKITELNGALVDVVRDE